MIDFSFDTLRPLGLTPMVARALATAEIPRDTKAHPAPPEWMRCAVVHRETLEVHNGVTQMPARCSAALTHALLTEESALAVGDWVLCQRDAYQQLWVIVRIPPLTQIVRRDADGSRHTVVSNVDIALLVMGLDLDFNLQRLERYLAMVGSTGVVPVVVLTKADVLRATSPGLVGQRVNEVRTRVGGHVDVLAVDGRDPEVNGALRSYLVPGQTLVLLGSSGAGKSTLTNSLTGTAHQDTGVVREHDSRGKHTTTARSLHLLPGGACVIDTPGVRTLRPDVDARTLTALFEDISALAAACRFRNCCHVDEPGCAVRDVVNPGRLKNYHKMLRESRRDSMTLLERQRQQSEWKARGRAGRQRLEIKREGR